MRLEKKEEKKDETLGALDNKFLETRCILLMGEINKELAEKIIRQLLLLEAMNAKKPIKLFIDSPGGDVDAGFGIFDMIRFIKPKVVIIGMGLVASAGALVLLAVPKERRLGLPNSHYLIHQPLSGIRGVATEIEIHANEMERIRVRINELIAVECDKSLAQVTRDTDRDYWMHSEESQKYGLISRIIKTESELNI